MTYLRKSYDKAVKDGYKGSDAWRMAIRGYLNGIHAQDKELHDGNVSTSQYEDNVMSGWDKYLGDGGLS